MICDPKHLSVPQLSHKHKKVAQIRPKCVYSDHILSANDSHMNANLVYGSFR